MTFYEGIVCWFVINELYVIYRFEIYVLKAKQKFGSNRANGLPSL